MDYSMTKRLSRIVLAVAVLLGPTVASAELDGDAMLSQARATAQEGRLLSCAGFCARLGERGHVDSATRCLDMCVERYDHARSRLDIATERALLADFAGLDSDTLRCRAKEKRREARGLKCLAACQRRPALGDEAAADASSHDLRRSREVCELKCQTVAAAPDLACPPADALIAGEQHHVGPGEDPSGHSATAPTVAETVRGFVPLPGGAVETDLAVVDGLAVFEGDIIVGRVEDVIAPPVANWGRSDEPGPLGAGRRLATYRWPKRILGGATIPFKIDSGLPNQARVTNAIAHWETKTAIRFVPRTTQTDYITFRSGTGCSSSVGRQGGQQYVNLASGCTTGSTIHEIGHAVGLWHEQTRADRDAYVTIKWSNIQSGKAGNFKTYTALGQDGLDLGAFDFGSIMMYGSFYFSTSTGTGKPTIVKKDGSTFTVQRTGLSTIDRAAVAKMYPSSLILRSPSLARLWRF
jgi:Astacin (Peptidase family M12A)